MRKTISLIAAALTAMALLASCGGGSSSTVAKNPEDEVRQTVTAFMDACLSFDTDEAKKYVTDENIDEIPDILDGIEETFGDFEDIIPEESKKAVTDKLSALVKDNIKYEIGEITIDGDEAQAKVNVSMPDFSNAMSDYSDEDFAKLIQTSFGLDSDDPMALINAFAQKKGVSVEDVYQMLSGDEADFIKDFYQTFKDETDKFIDGMVDMLGSSMKDAEQTDYPTTVTLEKQPDGKWLVSDMD